MFLASERRFRFESPAARNTQKKQHGNHDEAYGIGGDEDKSTININGTMAMGGG
jgi:hypothetical protein